MTDRLAAQRTRRAIGNASRAGRVERPLAVNRAGQTVDHATQQFFSDRNRETATAWEDCRAGSHSMRLSEGHQNEPLVAKAHDLGGNARGAGGGTFGIQVADLAEGQPQALDLQTQPNHLHDTALKTEPRRLGHDLTVGRQIKHSDRRLSRAC
jgi:hypothetical protein